MANKEDKARATPELAVARVFSAELRSLVQVVVVDVEDFHSLKIYQRGAQEMLGVLKRYTGAGDLEVIFGSGSTFLGSLVALNAACASGRWRVERPYKERRPG